MAAASTSFSSTKETTNYARLCRLLVDVGSQAVRDTFDKIHPPAFLHLVLTSPPVHSRLQSLRKWRILNATQWGKLYPAIHSSVSSANFDITLLILLLRNICGLPPPATGWDSLPPAADMSPEANIARIKYYRSHVYVHATKASVDDPTFDTLWQDISNAVVGLGGASYEAPINKLKTDSMDPEIEEHSKELLKEWKKDHESTKDKLEELKAQYQAAYNRALQAGGGTYDKRVKVLLVGQDRVGKTSLCKFLRGEAFNENEPSTVGVHMIPPVKNAGTEAWRNPPSLEHTTPFDHKMAAVVTRELLSASVEQTPKKKSLESPFKDVTGDKIQEPTRVASNETSHMARENEKQDRDAQEEDSMSKQCVFLVDQQLKKNQVDQDDKIWPVIWDFAGQDIYRAIHPIFMSSEDIYLLVSDLTKELSAIAECRVNFGRGEDTVRACDSEDTNLDHLLRWLDLIHSLQKCDHNKKSASESLNPTVILVGTHADCVEDPSKAINLLKEQCLKEFKVFNMHIRKCSVIDNRQAGKSEHQEKIMKLREDILKLADKMPHTKEEIPLQWHRVEREILEISKNTGKRYLSKKTFQEDIVSKYCTLGKGDDFDALIYFLHGRGTIVYHEDTSDKDGLVILDPQWLINVLCEIIRVDPHDEDEESMSQAADRVKLRKEGILSRQLIDRACENLEIEDIKVPLISLMEKFNLICQWPAKENGDPLILVPCMLTTEGKKEIAMDDTGVCPAPVYLYFEHTNYVPSGLFCRLVVLFLKWLKDPQYKHEYELFANGASFALDQYCSLHLVCYKTVIKLHISTSVDVTSQKDNYYKNVLRNLKEFLETLKKESHWLHSMSVTLCARCTICLGKNEEPCNRHGERRCKHHDCSHYIPLEANVLCCKPNKPLPMEPLEPWIRELHHFTSCGTAQSHLGNSGETLKVALLADEWRSSKGGLSTINRTLAIFLAKTPKVNVTFVVPQDACNDQDKQSALKHRITVREVTSRAGYAQTDWLISPPKKLNIDVVIGHSAILGKPAQFITESHSCKWVQVVHTEPEELAMHKNYPSAIAKGQEKNRIEVDLCKRADLVVAVGPKLTEAISSQLRSSHQDIFQLTPGTFREFADVKEQENKEQENGKFRVLVFGRGDSEDFNLKGYDIAASAIVELNDSSYRLIFVGAPDGKQDEVAATLIQHAKISKNQLTVRSFIQQKNKLKDLFCEVDVAIMPSRTEGFGLTALEAMSAGLPILVSRNSGFGEALCCLPCGRSFVVESEDFREWAKAISALRRKSRTQRLQEVRMLRTSYEETYSWEKQCQSLVDRMWKMVHGLDKSKKGQSSVDDFKDDAVTVQAMNDAQVTRAEVTFCDLQQRRRDANMVINKTGLPEELKTIASDKGFVISNNQGSGNCMFYALSEQLDLVTGIQISHEELRQSIVHYLQVNHTLPNGTQLFNFVDGYPSWDAYLRNMMVDGTWGDHVILYAAANRFKTYIRVISSLPRHDDLIIRPESDVTSSNPLVLGHVYEHHYVSLRPK